MNTQRRVTPFGAQSTAAEVFKGIDLLGESGIDLATARYQQTMLATLQRPAPCCESWSTTPSTGARETWLEEYEGHNQDYVCRGRAKRLLGRRRIVPLRRNLTPST